MDDVQKELYRVKWPRLSKSIELKTAEDNILRAVEQLGYGKGLRSTIVVLSFAVKAVLPIDTFSQLLVDSRENVRC